MIAQVSGAVGTARSSPEWTPCYRRSQRNFRNVETSRRLQNLLAPVSFASFS